MAMLACCLRRPGARFARSTSLAGRACGIHTRSTFSTEAGTWIEDGHCPSSSRSCRPSRTPRTRSSSTLTGVPDRPGRRRRDLRRGRRRSTSTSTRSSRTSRTASAELSFSRPAGRRARDPARARARRGGARADRGRGDRPTSGKVVARRCRDALAPRRRGADVPNARRRRHQPPADLDLADQGLVPHSTRSTSSARFAPCTRRSRSASSRFRTPSDERAEPTPPRLRAGSQSGSRSHRRGLDRARRRRALPAPVRVRDWGQPRRAQHGRIRGHVSSG